MSKYVIRMDDACPTMNHLNWKRIENILDSYGVKPIVGVIPDNKDSEFNWEYHHNFWDIVQSWQEKDWIIAQHGYEHRYHYHVPGKGYFQRSHSINTEFAGLSYEEQMQKLKSGYEILLKKGIKPTCFFAPAHTFDSITIEALKELKGIEFVSDGYALYSYKKQGMLFLPSICDGPFSIPMWGGIYTFVFHPSVMKDGDFKRLENFLRRNDGKIISAKTAIEKSRDNQGVLGHIMEYLIFYARAIRKMLRKESMYICF